jgi:putative intracellular protease/amidase
MGVVDLNPAGFRLGIYVYDDAEVADLAAPYLVFGAAKKLDPALDALLLADDAHPRRTRDGSWVRPHHGLINAPPLDALLIPGGPGAPRAARNPKLRAFLRALPETTLFVAIREGGTVFGRLGLPEAAPETDCPPPRPETVAAFSRARIVESGRLIAGAGRTSATEVGLHLLRRAGRPTALVRAVARELGHESAYDLFRRSLDPVA